ncbi:MAG: T9SS type A sorting domain-containing protein [Crocinitomicaceae bacterium]
MKFSKHLFTLLVCSLITNLNFAQCAAGEVEVIIEVTSDDYGYEGYWELVPTGNACGTGTVASGGNNAVGCSGAGVQTQTPGGYGNNQVFTEGPWCLVEGACFDIHYKDDWGDGGFEFTVFVNGFEVENFLGPTGLNEVFTFCASEPQQYDLAASSSNLVTYVASGAFDLSTTFYNNGTEIISSYDFNYSVDGGATQTYNVTGSSLANTQDEAIDHSIPINLTTNGNYTIKMWADNLNGGNSDGNTANDTLTAFIEVGPGTPNFIDQYINATVSVDLIAGASDQVNQPTDLDFHPTLTNNELWVCNKNTENSGGSTVTIFNAGLPSQTSVYKQDGNAWHFMSLPTGIAFSENGNWANSPGVYDANHDGGTPFTGPSLWSSDLTVYAEPSGGNGSHLDMLHLSPECQGICAEKDNVFWVFDGYNGDIVRYDFVEDHGPGASYHGDATAYRYGDDAVAKDPSDNVVSHMILDGDKKWLYAVDHGNQRVIRIDITTGSDSGVTPSFPMYEAIADYKEYTGYTQELVVSGLDKPAGIDVIGNRMIVSEHQTGEIIIYDISTVPAVELGTISTGFNTVQGIKIGPNGRIWFVDQSSNGVYKINSPELGLSELSMELEIYPNPSAGSVNVILSSEINGNIEVRDSQGKLMTKTEVTGQSTHLDLNVATGTYFVQLVTDGFNSEVKSIVVQNQNN